MNDEILVEHMQADAAFQEETRHIHAEQSIFKAETEGSLAELHAKIEGLATKQDIKDLKEDLKGYFIGGDIFKYAFNNGGKITGLLGLIAIAFLVIKYGFAGLIAFFVHTIKPE